MIKFVAPKARKPFYRDQVATKQYYIATVSTKVSMREVPPVEEEQEVLEDVSRTPEAKVMKELVRYDLDELSLDSFFLNDSNLKER